MIDYIRFTCRLRNQEVQRTERKVVLCRSGNRSWDEWFDVDTSRDSHWSSAISALVVGKKSSDWSAQLIEEITRKRVITGI